MASLRSQFREGVARDFPSCFGTSIKSNQGYTGRTRAAAGNLRRERRNRTREGPLLFPTILPESWPLAERSVAQLKDFRVAVAGDSCFVGAAIIGRGTRSVFIHTFTRASTEGSKLPELSQLKRSTRAPAPLILEVPVVESPWHYCYEVGRLGFAFPSSSLGGDCPHTLKETSLGLQANGYLSSVLGRFEPKKGAAIFFPAREVNDSPGADVTSGSEIYSVPVFAATRGSPSCTGTRPSLKVQSRSRSRNRCNLAVQNAQQGLRSTMLHLGVST